MLDDTGPEQASDDVTGLKPLTTKSLFSKLRFRLKINFDIERNSFVNETPNTIDLENTCSCQEPGNKYG